MVIFADYQTNFSMKVLKIVTYILLAILIIASAAIFMMPTEYSVERSITINAPKKLVTKQAFYFENFAKWNPWAKYDPNMTTTLDGTDGTVGAKYAWVGNKDVGTGSMEITSASDSRVEQKLIFLEPFESEAITYLTVEETEGGVKVTWGMAGNSARPMNLMNSMMDGMIGKDYEGGLADLKKLVEGIASSDTFRGYKIEATELSPRTYVGKKDTVPFTDMETFLGANFGAAMGALLKKKAPIAGMPSGIYFMWDEPNQQTVMAAVVPVEGEYALPGFDAIPASGPALKIAFYGSFDASAEAHYAMDDYLAAKGLEYGDDDLVIEEYVTDPATEPDTTKWLTNIYYVLN